MSGKEIKALVLRLYEKFDKGEWDDIAEDIDSNFIANVLGTTTLDWAGFKQFGNAFLSAFPDGRHVFEHVVADGENVVTIGTWLLFTILILWHCSGKLISKSSSC